MVYDKIPDVIETIRSKKLPLVRVYYNGNITYAQEETGADPDKVADELEEYLTNREGNGYVEVGLYEKTMKEAGRGGMTRPKYKFIIRIGQPSGATGLGSVAPSVSSSREKELRDENDELKMKILRMENRKRLTY